MVESIQTQAQLLAAFASGVPDLITPSAMRRFLVTAHGDYATLWLSSPTTMAISSTPAKMILFDQAAPVPVGVQGETLASPANNEFTVQTDGVFLVIFHASFSVPTSGDEYTFELYEAGAQMSTRLRAESVPPWSANNHEAAFHGLVEASAGDVLSIYAINDAVGSITTNIDICRVSLLRIA